MNEEQQKAYQEALRRQQAQQQAQLELQAKIQKAQQQAQQRQQLIDTLPRQQYAIIVAVDNQGGFSKNNEIPWHYPDDLEWFKHRTINNICVMGKTTYEDICKRRGDKATDSVLPDRKCFVVSSTLNPSLVKNATVIKHITEVVLHLSDSDYEKTIFCIGGGQIYNESLSLANTVFITAINKDYDCDKFFNVNYVDNHFVHSQTFKCNNPDLRFLCYTRTM